MITKKNEPIYMRADGTYVIQLDGFGYHATNTTGITITEVEAYLADHPEALVPEPTPPAPTLEQLKSQAEAQRQALFAEYDLAIKMLTRAERLGDSTASAKIRAWDLYAKALQNINNTDDWYINTQWPEKPIGN